MTRLVLIAPGVLLARPQYSSVARCAQRSVAATSGRSPGRERDVDGIGIPGPPWKKHGGMAERRKSHGRHGGAEDLYLGGSHTDGMAERPWRPHCCPKHTT